MFRIILVILFFLVSLLAIFPAPFQFAWLVAVSVSAYSCAYIIVTLVLFLWCFFSKKFRGVGLVLCGIAIVLYASPDVRAYSVAKDLPQRIEAAYGVKPGDMQGFTRKRLTVLEGFFPVTVPKKLPQSFINMQAPVVSTST